MASLLRIFQTDNNCLTFQALEDENDSLQNVIERNRRQALGTGDDYSGSEGMGHMGGLQDWDSEAGSPGPGGRKRKRALVGGSRATSVDMQSLNGDVKGAVSQIS